MPPIEWLAVIAIIVGMPGKLAVKLGRGGSLSLEAAFAAMIPTKVMAKVVPAAVVVPRISLSLQLLLDSDKLSTAFYNHEPYKKHKK